MFKLVAVLSAALLCAPTRGQGDASGEKMDVFRLPEDQVTPLSYDLQFTPYLQNFSFSGVAKIKVVVGPVSINTVTLNLKDLELTNVTVMDIRSQDLFANYSYIAKNEQLVIRLIKNVPSTKELLLTISYRGEIRNDMTGLYMSSYDENGVTK